MEGAAHSPTGRRCLRSATCCATTARAPSARARRSGGSRSPTLRRVASGWCCGSSPRAASSAAGTRPRPCSLNGCCASSPRSTPSSSVAPRSLPPSRGAAWWRLASSRFPFSATQGGWWPRPTGRQTTSAPAQSGRPSSSTPPAACAGRRSTSSSASGSSTSRTTLAACCATLSARGARTGGRSEHCRYSRVWLLAGGLLHCVLHRECLGVRCLF
mmetsp:Transcript_67715/g.163723  ORF Transcript_67715/g.163723 Transcript_67715/m.163723 type:complete len:215 (+) Transcript_67715:359-1003(+)